MTRAATKPVAASTIAERFGFTARHWIRQAAEGRVPGAYQPSGPGGRWLFDEAVFEHWYRSRVREARLWQPSTRGERSIGAVPNVRGGNSGSPLRQEIDELLKNVCNNGSRTSKPRHGATSRVLPLRKP